MNRDYQGIFDGKFELDSPVKTAVYKFAEENSEAVADAISRMLHHMLVRTRTQLKDFLQGGNYGAPPSPEMEQILKHCPVTNLIGENAFGDLDFDMNRRRHTTFHHRSTMQMWKHNRTGQWLSGKQEEEQTRLMSIARKHGKILRYNHRQQEKIVMLKIRGKRLMVTSLGLT